MKVKRFKESGREKSFEYVVPTVNDFANAMNFAYGVNLSDEEAKAFAQSVGGQVVDESYIESKIRRMHLAEGCTSGNCVCSDEYDEYENSSCSLAAEERPFDADGFVDHVDVEFDDDDDDE